MSLRSWAALHPSVSYLLDPRFPGGTSAAVAQELNAVSDHFRPQVFGLSGGMFAGRETAPALAKALEQNVLGLTWDPPVIQSDTVILHNPSFLKFSRHIDCRILTQKLLVVSHENFIRPGGAPAFDVAHCLDQIDAACLAGQKIIAPISHYNRETVLHWLRDNPAYGHWTVLDQPWFNICEFGFSEPSPNPADRRGRLSRPGFEKFPPLGDLEQCFSKSAQSNIILGADNLMDLSPDHPHWQLVAFRGMEVQKFMDGIDFMVYFTSSCWRESFGRVIAESTAAGKVVLTDAGTAAMFGPGVISAIPAQVDEIIGNLVANPKQYAAQVGQAQKVLRTFGASQFLEFYSQQLNATTGIAA